MVPAKEWPLPADLAVVVLHTFVTAGALLVPLVSGTPLRSVVGLSFVVFTPGYTVVSVLFPERYRSTEPAGGTSTTEAGGVLLARFRGSAGIGPVERAEAAEGETGEELESLLLAAVVFHLNPAFNIRTAGDRKSVV